MKEKDLLKVLQFYRHDIMNHLQVIHGYLNIGQQEKVTTKINDIMHHFKREKKLMDTNAPHFILWMLQVNHLEENIRVNYNFQYEKANLMTIDETLTEQSKQIINCIRLSGDPFELYKTTFNFSKDEYNPSIIRVTIHISGQIDKESISSHLSPTQINNPMRMDLTENGLTVNLTYFLNEGD